MVGGTPSLIAANFWFSALRRHSTASNASSGYRLYLLTARLTPPMVTRLGVPASTAGYRAQPTLRARSGAASPS